MFSFLHLLILILILILLLLLPFPSPSHAATFPVPVFSTFPTTIDPNKTQIVLGLAYPLTSMVGNGAQGQRSLITSMVAIQEINARTDLLPNHQLMIRWSDTKGEPQTGVQVVFHHLFPANSSSLSMTSTDPSLVGIVGEFFSSVSGPIAALAAVFDTPVVSPASTSDELSNEKIYPNFARTISPDGQQSIALTQLILSQGWKHVQLIYADDAYGRPFASGLQTHASVLAQAGLPTILYTNVISFATGIDTDKDIAITTASTSSTRIILIICLQKDVRFFLQRAWELGMMGKYQFIGTDGWTDIIDSDSELRDNLTLWAEGVIGTQPSITQTSISTALLNNSCYMDLPIPTSFTVDRCGVASIYASYAYDAIYLYSIALHNMYTNNITINGTNFIKQFQQITFQGATGNVSLDINGDRYAAYDFFNIRNGHYGSFGQWTQTATGFGKTTITSKPIYYDGASSALDIIPVQTYIYRTTAALRIAVYVLSSMVTLFIICIGIIIWIKRDTLVVKASSLPFCFLILFFLATLSISAIFYALTSDDHPFVCNLRPWATALSLVGVLSTLITKTNRIRLIYLNTALMDARVGLFDLAVMVCCLMGIEIALLIGYTAARLSTPQLYMSSSLGLNAVATICSSTESSTYIIWLCIQFGYVLFLLLGALYIAFGVRNTPTAFNESSHLCVCVFILTFFLVILVPLQFLLDSSPNAVLLCRGIGQTMCALGMAATLFIPKIWYILIGKANDKTMRIVHHSPIVPPRRNPISAISTPWLRHRGGTAESIAEHEKYQRMEEQVNKIRTVILNYASKYADESVEKNDDCIQLAYEIGQIVAATPSPIDCDDDTMSPNTNDPSLSQLLDMPGQSFAAPPSMLRPRSSEIPLSSTHIKRVMSAQQRLQVLAAISVQARPPEDSTSVAQATPTPSATYGNNPHHHHHHLPTIPASHSSNDHDGRMIMSGCASTQSDVRTLSDAMSSIRVSSMEYESTSPQHTLSQPPTQMRASSLPISTHESIPILSHAHTLPSRARAVSGAAAVTVTNTPSTTTTTYVPNTSTSTSTSTSPISDTCNPHEMEPSCPEHVTTVHPEHAPTVRFHLPD